MASSNTGSSGSNNASNNNATNNNTAGNDSSQNSVAANNNANSNDAQNGQQNGNNGQQQYSSNNPAPISSSNILTFFGPAEPQNIHGTIVNSIVVLPPLTPGVPISLAFNYSAPLPVSHGAVFQFGSVGPIEAGFPTTYTPQGENIPENNNLGNLTLPQLFLIVPAAPAVTPTPITDLGVTISPQSGIVIAGTDLTYTITYTNHGPTTVTSFDMTDALPYAFDGQALFGSVSSGSIVYSYVPGTGIGDAIWSGSLAPGQSITSTIQGFIDPFATQPLPDTVNITDTTPNVSDTDTADKSASSLLNLQSDVDLSLVKSDTQGGSSGGLVGIVQEPSSIGAVSPGAEYTYTIYVTNSGPSGLTSLTLSDVFPVGFSPSSFTPSEGSYNSTTGLWSGLNFAPGEVINLQIGGALSSNVANLPADGDVINTVTVTVPAGTIDTNPTITVMDTDILNTLSKSDSGGGNSATDTIGTVVAGQSLTYSITVSNMSTHAETGSISDPLYTQFTNDTWTVSSVNGAYIPGSPNNVTSGSGAISESLSLPADSSITFTISGTEALTATGTVSNQATYTPTGSVPIVVVDTDNVVTLVKTDSGGGSSPTSALPDGLIGTFVAGSNESYSVTITNTSTATVSGVITDSDYLNLFQNGTVSWSANASSASDTIGSSSGNGAINDSVSMIGGSSVTFTISGLVPANEAPGQVSNTADFTPGTSNTPIPATDVDNIVQQANLTIVKSDNDGGSSAGSIGTVVAGNSIAYTITVENSGPSIATNVVVDDYQLPVQGLLNITSPNLPNGVTFNASNDTWTVGTLNPGASVTLSLDGTVPSSAEGSYVNQVYASSGDATTVYATDTDNLNSLVKTDSAGGSSATGADGVFVPGAQETYYITVSNTSNNAVTGTISDPLLNTQFASDTWTVSSVNGAYIPGSPNNITSGSGPISEPLSLPADSSITFAITGNILQTATGTIDNQATYTPAGAQPYTVTDYDNIMTMVKTDSGGGSSPTEQNPNGIVGHFIAGANESYSVTLDNTSVNPISGYFYDPLNASTSSFSWQVSETGGASAMTLMGSGPILAANEDYVTLPGGSTLTFTFTGVLALNAPSWISNTADFVPTGSTTPVGVTDIDTVGQEANLTIIKSDNDGGSSTGAIGTAVAGSNISYTITVENTGPSIATNVVIDDYKLPLQGLSNITSPNLPAGVTFNSTSDTWSIAALNPNQSIQLTLDGTIPSSATGSYVNNVYASASDATTVYAVDTDNLNSLVKSDSAGGNSATGASGVFIPGAQETYYVTVSNTSGNAVTGTISDPLLNTQFASDTWTVSSVNGAYIPGSPHITSGSGAISESLYLPANSSITFAITGNILETATGTSNNVATYTPTGAQPYSVTDYDNVMTLVKTDSGGGSSATGAVGTFIAGANESYSVVLHNTSTNPISGYFYDTLNASTASFSWQVSETGGASAMTSMGSGPITAANEDFVSLPGGSTLTFTFSGVLATNAPSSIVNVADFVPFGSTTPVGVTDTDNVNQQANLTIVKSDNDGGSSTGAIGTAVAGSNISYTITVENTGPSIATNVVIDDYKLPLQGLSNITSPNLPAGVTFNSTSDTWSIAALNPNQSIQLTLDGTIPSSATGSYVNNVYASASDATTVYAVDTDNLNSLVKSDSAGGNSATGASGVFIPGAQETYYVTVSNTSGNAVTGTISDPLLNTQFASDTWTVSSVNGAYIPGSPHITSGSGAISESLYLPANSSITFAITGNILETATGTSNNVATYTPNGAQPYSVTDYDNIMTLVKTDSGGGSSATGAVGTFIAGANESYSVVLHNTSTNPISGYFYDTLNASTASFSWQVSETGGASAMTSMGSGPITAANEDFVSLPGGSTLTFTFSGVLATNAPSSIVNVADFVPFGSTTPVGVTDTDNVDQQANLTIVKSDNDGGSSTGAIGTAVAGSNISYTITVENTGPSIATNVVIDDYKLPLQGLSNITSPNLPAGVTFNSTSDTWSIAALNPNQSIQLTLDGTIPSSATGSYVNNVYASASDATTVYAVDTDNLNSLVKSDSAGGNSATGASGVFIPGAQETYYVTVSNTSGNAVTGTISDPLLNTQFASDTWTVSSVNGAYIPGSPHITSGSGAISESLYLPANSSITFAITGNILETATGTSNNVATYTPNGAQPYSVTDYDNVMTLVKTDSGGGSSATGAVGTFIAGANESYSVVLHNTSTNPISGYFYDTLNASTASFSWQVSETGGASAMTSMGSGPITAANEDFVSLPGGSTLTFTFSGVLATNAPSSIVNVADFVPFGSTTPVGVTDTDNVNQQANLTIVKSDNDGGSSTGAIGTAVAGSNISYTITVENTGPSIATNVVIDDYKLPLQGLSNITSPNLPAGVTFNSTSDTWSIAALNPNQSIQLTLDGTIPSSATGSYVNNVYASASDATTVYAVDTDNLNSLVKSDSAGGNSATGASGVFIPGAQETYYVTVSNTSGNAVTGMISDPLLNTQFASDTWTVSSVNGAYIPGSPHITSGSGAISESLYLPANSSITFAITGNILETATGTSNNVATYTPNGAQPYSVTDYDNIMTLVKTDSGGGSSATGAVGTFIAGANESYSVVLHNTSTNPISGYFYDTLNASTASFSWQVSETGGASAMTSMGSGPITAANEDFVSLPGGSTLTFTFSGVLATNAPSSIVNVADFVPFGSTTPVGVTDTDNVNQQANLTISKVDNDGGSSITHAEGNAIVGTSIQYTIVVDNTGPSIATDVVVKDTLPSQGLSNITSPDLPNGVSFNPSNDTWTIASLDPNSSINLQLDGTIPASATGSTYVNMVTASASDASQVSATDTDLLSQQCDLSISKTASVAVPYLSQQETYSVAISNSGPSAASNVVVTDPLPLGITYVSGSANDSGVFNSGTDTITWTLSSLAVSSPLTLTFNATVNNFAYEQGSLSASSLSAEQTAWGFSGGVAPSSLHPYASGVSFLNSSNNLDTTFANAEAAADVTSAWNAALTLAGIGVLGSTSNEVDYANGQSESMVVNLGHNNIDYATVTLSGLASGAQGEVFAYNSSGVQVGGPIIIEGSTDSNSTGTVTISPGAEFQYLAFEGVPSVSGGNSSFYVENINSMPESITNTATISSTTTNSNSANDMSSYTITPEVPVAKVGSEVVVQGAANTNILIVLDKSGSMADDVTVNGVTEPKIQAALQAIDQLLSLYGDAGNVAVKIVDFSSSATILTSTWVSIATAESDLSNITPSGTTNYDAALGLHPDGVGINYTSGAEEAFTTTGASGAGYIAGGTNVLYFLTDGGPNEPSGSAGINPAYSGNAGEEAQWDAFLSSNNITAFTVAMGLSGSALASASGGTNNDTVSQELTPIASNSSDAIFASNLDQLSADLNGTIVNHTGNLLTETGSSFGTDTPGYIQSIALIGDGYTYQFNPTTDTVTTLGSGSSTESLSGDVLTITSSTLGTLSVNMETGAYTYGAPSSILTSTSVSLPVEFTIADAANNLATGMLTITDTHDAVTVANSSSSSEGIMVTIIDESNPHNDYSQLLTVPADSSGSLAITIPSDFSFSSSDKYAVSLEQAPGNTTALSITALYLDGLNLHTSSGALLLGGAGNPYAATYEFQGTTITQSETLSSTSASDSLIHYLYNSASGVTLSSSNSTASSLADFLNAPNNSTIDNTHSSPSVMLYSPTDTYNGNGSDILLIDQGALGLQNNTSTSVNLTGNESIHNIGQILLADGNTGGTTSLTLSAQDVFDFTENSAHTSTANSNTLYINGTTGDTANIGSGWTTGATSGNYTLYTETVNSATDHLYIQNQIHVVHS